jgi:hypothetical protein
MKVYDLMVLPTPTNGWEAFILTHTLQDSRLIVGETKRLNLTVLVASKKTKYLELDMITRLPVVLMWNIFSHTDSF